MTTKKTAKAAEVPAAEETKYTKTALVRSGRFEARRDLLTAILDDGEMYTIAEAEKKINDYLNKEV